MDKLLKVAMSTLMVMATVCLIGCNKVDDPNNDDNNGSNGGNSGETPETPAIVSTSEVQYDGTVYVEAVFEDETKMYFEILSPNEVALVSGEFYYQDNSSLAYLYRGDVVIPKNVKHLGTIYTVVSIAKKAFYRNEMVTSVYIPNTVTTINSCGSSSSMLGAFHNCSNIRNIHMSNNIQSIGDNSFAGCLCYEDTVTIPHSVKQIGKDAFDSKTICFNADSCLVAGGYFMGIVYRSAFPNMYSISFGTNVKVLPAYLFSGSDIMVVEIPSSVTILPDYAFSGCSTIERINNFENILEIGTAAFQGCESLASVRLGPNLVEIKSHTFYNCKSLTEVYLPSSLQRISKLAFATDSSSGWGIPTIITCMALVPPVLEEDVFKCRGIRTIYVPDSSVEVYKIADGWSNYADVIVGIP